MTQPQTIHHALARSYLSFLLASLLGLLLDALFVSVRFDVPYAHTIALLCFGLGPALILWAQLTSENASKYFLRGPYQFVRNPTHLGILILVTGYTLVSGSVIFFGLTLIGYLVSNVFFTKYESLLEVNDPDQYKTYRTRTPKI